MSWHLQELRCWILTLGKDGPKFEETSHREHSILQHRYEPVPVLLYAAGDIRHEEFLPVETVVMKLHEYRLCRTMRVDVGYYSVKSIVFGVYGLEEDVRPVMQLASFALTSLEKIFQLADGTS